MNERTRSLLEQLLKLSPSERAEMAALLLKSLDDETEEGVEAAWLKEVEERMARLDSGEDRALPWSEVRAQLYADRDA